MAIPVLGSVAPSFTAKAVIDGRIRGQAHVTNWCVHSDKDTHRGVTEGLCVSRGMAGAGIHTNGEHRQA